MPDLLFDVLGASSARDMITPAISFELRIANRIPEESIQAIILRCQIQIEVARRRYDSREQGELREVFDRPARWGDTLRPLTWANISASIPCFSGSTTYPLLVPCSFDFSIATAKYFRALEDGDVPLTFLFSGSVFYNRTESGLQVAPIPWNNEARFRLPIAVWKSLLDLHYPNAVCLNLRRDVFDELYRYKLNSGFTSFEEAIQQMLALAEQERSLS